MPMDQAFENLKYKLDLSNQLKRGPKYYEKWHGGYFSRDRKAAEHRSRNGKYKNHRRG